MATEVTAATDTTEVAKRLVCAHLRAGDLALDATCGNGWDTLAMRQAVGSEGRVVALDIQTPALEATRELLREHGCEERVDLVQASHVTLAEYLPQKARVIMFNLGYLPGGDKSITTTATDTMLALPAALDALDEGGLLSIVVYPGHETGEQEANEIDSWIAGLDDTHRVFSYRRTNSQAPAPYAWFIQP